MAQLEDIYVKDQLVTPLIVQFDEEFEIYDFK